MLAVVCYVDVFGQLFLCHNVDNLEVFVTSSISRGLVSMSLIIWALPMKMFIKETFSLGVEIADCICGLIVISFSTF